MSTNNTLDLEFEAEVFFGNAQEAAAGKRALEAVGFDLEPHPGLAEDNHQTVWMMAYGACPGDADTPEIIQNLEALIKPHGGMIWELGPIGSEGEPAPPRLYEMMKHAVFVRTNLYPLQFPTRDLEQPGRSDD